MKVLRERGVETYPFLSCFISLLEKQNQPLSHFNIPVIENINSDGKIC